MLQRLFGMRNGQPLSDKHKVFIAFGFMAILIAFIAFRVSTGFADPGDAPQKPRSQAEFIALVKQVVGKHLTLPSGDPIVERIDLPDLRLKVNPAFYAGVQVNDLVIHYPTLVILYRPASDEVVRTEPIAAPPDQP